MPKIKPKFVIHSDQYGPVAVEADGNAHTMVDGEWFHRADAPELANGETIVSAAWSPQMGLMVTTSSGKVFTHDLGHVAEWRQF